MSKALQRSRKGCFSCKKLRIKCSESWPKCEYCSSTGRRCVYPSEFQKAPKDLFPQDILTDLKISDDAEDSSTISPELEDEIFSSARRLTFHILLNATATQLNISRFELRVLRFFNDVCVQLFTFGVNKKHVHIYEQVMPRYFVKSKVLRLAIYSFACLGLWQFLELDHVLQVDISDEKQVLLLDDDSGDLSLLFNDPNVFGEEEDCNVFRRTAMYYSDTLAESSRTVSQLQDKAVSNEERTEKLVCMILSSSMVYGFLACHPHRIVPLVSFPQDGDEPVLDLLLVISGMKLLASGSMDDIKNSDIRDLYELDEWKINTKRVCLVEELRKQMIEHYHAIQFLDFGNETNEEFNVLSQCLQQLNKCMGVSIKFNYPVVLFRWLGTVPIEFASLVRRKTWMALRMLFVYSCLCMYCRFTIHHQSIWRDYIKWFHRASQPMCEFDQRLYHYIIKREKMVSNGKYLFLAKFDVWSSEFDMD